MMKYAYLVGLNSKLGDLQNYILVGEKEAIDFKQEYPNCLLRKIEFWTKNSKVIQPKFARISTNMGKY